MDKVFIENLKAYTIIGVEDWERSNAQAILISVSLTTNTRKAGISDNIADCINYDSLGQKIKQLVQNSTRYTVEALATDVANLCLSESEAQAVIVRIEKPGALPDAKSAGVEILRTKGIDF